MNVKKLTIVLLCSFAIIANSLAQVQQGYVKTRGRMINGKHVRGSGLPGASVRLYGDKSVLAKGANGAFSLVVPSKKFLIKEVKMGTYQLLDPDIINKPYQVSNNPLYLVMETPEKQKSDKVETEMKIRRQLNKQLQQKEREIEALKEQNKITQQEYHKQLQQLCQQQGNNEKLISDMAERYASLDYDQLDDFYRQVASFIEDGELVRADSMLRSRGNVREQVAAQLRRGQIIEKEKEKLQKAETVFQADNNELAQRCYSYYETYLAQHQNDSALHYLQLRLELDTTNVKWLTETALFVQDYLADYSSALEYLQKALELEQNVYGNEQSDVAVSYYNISITNFWKGNYEEALNFVQKAIGIWLKLDSNENLHLASCYNIISSIYSRKGDYAKAFAFQQKALDIRLKHYGQEHLNVAESYFNMGSIYAETGHTEEALHYWQKALNIQLRIYGDEHLDIAKSYNNIGAIYNKKGDYITALDYLQNALNIQLRIYGEEHPNIARAYNNISFYYFKSGDYIKGIEYLHKSLEILLKFLGEEHPDIAMAYNNIGIFYCKTGDYIKGIEYLRKSLEIRLIILDEEHPDIARSYFALGLGYIKLENYETAIGYLHKALAKFEGLLGADHPDTELVRKQLNTAKENIQNNKE